MSVGVKGAAVPVCRKQGGLRPCDAVRKRRCRFRDREWGRYRQEKAAPAGSMRPELGNRLWTSLGFQERNLSSTHARSHPKTQPFDCCSFRMECFMRVKPLCDIGQRKSAMVGAGS